MRRPARKLIREVPAVIIPFARQAASRFRPPALKRRASRKQQGTPVKVFARHSTRAANSLPPERFPDVRAPRVESASASVLSSLRARTSLGLAAALCLTACGPDVASTAATAAKLEAASAERARAQAEKLRQELETAAKAMEAAASAAEQ